MFRTKTKVTPGMALCVFADALMVNLSLLAGFTFTLWYYLLAGKFDPAENDVARVLGDVRPLGSGCVAAHTHLHCRVLPHRLLHLRPVLSGPLQKR